MGLDTGAGLRKAFEWKANENLSNEEIVRRLNARGLKMYMQRLSEILRNPFYCGYIEHRYLGEGVRIKGVQEPMISEEMFNKVQENLEGNHDHYEHRDITPEFPLKRTMLCPYYKANTKGYPANVSASTVHQGYINLLNQYRVPDELHSIMEDVLTDKLFEKVELDRMEAEDIEKRLAALDRKIKAVRLKYALDEIDEATCNDAVAALQEKKAEYPKTGASPGIYWDNEKKRYLTIEESKVLGLFRSISSDYEAATNEKQDKSCDLSCLVAPSRIELLSKV